MLVAVDTGGTKTLVASFNRNGTLGEQIKFPTPQDPAEYTKALRSLLKETYSKEHVDAIVEQPFTPDFAALSAEDFITRVLKEGLGTSHVVTGFDFHFGRKRQGGPAYLMESGKRHNFGVTLVDAFRDEGVEVISSSRIRDLLAALGEAAIRGAQIEREDRAAALLHPGS